TVPVQSTMILPVPMSMGRAPLLNLAVESAIAPKEEEFAVAWTVPDDQDACSDRWSSCLSRGPWRSHIASGTVDPPWPPDQARLLALSEPPDRIRGRRLNRPSTGALISTPPRRRWRSRLPTRDGPTAPPTPTHFRLSRPPSARPRPRS